MANLAINKLTLGVFGAIMATSFSGSEANAMGSYGQEHVDPYAGFPTTYTTGYNNNPYASGQFAQYQGRPTAPQPVAPARPPQPAQPVYPAPGGYQNPSVPVQYRPVGGYQPVGTATPPGAPYPQYAAPGAPADTAYGATPFKGTAPSTNSFASKNKNSTKMNSYTSIGLMYPMLDDVELRSSIAGLERAAFDLPLGANISVGTDIGYSIDAELEVGAKYSAGEDSDPTAILDKDYLSIYGMVNGIYSPEFANIKGYQIYGGLGLGYAATEIGDLEDGGFAFQWLFGVKTNISGGVGRIGFKLYSGPDIEGQVDGINQSYSDSHSILEIGYTF